MFRIAICDDDEKICRDLINILNQIQDLKEYGYDVKTFSSGESLHKFIYESENDFDIIFLDIQLSNNMNGIEAGNVIRNHFYQENIIIYISSYEQYAMDLFQIRPFDFVIKPLSLGKIRTIILRIIDIINRQKEPFRYKIRNNIYEIDLYKILYFISYQRKIEIMTYNKDMPNKIFYGKISEIGKQLYDSDFFFIHKSYLVNYRNVADFQYEKIILTNGKELPISRNYKKEVRDMYLKKIGENRNDK